MTEESLHPPQAAVPSFSSIWKARLAGGPRRLFRLDTVYWLAAFCAVFWIVHALSVGGNNTILDHHAFRQTQTADSVLFLLRGGAWLNYETPILGYPWSIPFEFPLYQWCAALFSKVSGLPLEPAGRVVGASFFVASFIPLWNLLGHLGLRRTERLPAVLFFALCPTYLFWSRTLMIESTALFTALLFLERTAAFLSRPATTKKTTLIGWGASGALGALVKSTTFVPFALGAAGATAYVILRRWRQGERRDAKRLLVIAAVIFAVTFAFMQGWAAYAEHVRTLNPLARTFLDTKHLSPWIFGTWAERASLASWQVWYVERLPFFIGGAPWVLSLFVPLPFVVERKLGLLALCSVALQAVTFGIFTNLHLVHDYYQCATAVFLTTAVGLSVAGLMRHPRWAARFAALVLTLFVGKGMVDTTRTFVLPQQALDNRSLDPLIQLIATTTKPDDVLYLVGGDWSPIVPYYCGRRAVLDRESRPMNDPVIVEELELLRTHGYRIGALLACGAEVTSPATPQRQAALGLSVFRGTVSGCSVFTRAD